MNAMTDAPRTKDRPYMKRAMQLKYAVLYRSVIPHMLDCLVV